MEMADCLHLATISCLEPGWIKAQNRKLSGGCQVTWTSEKFKYDKTKKIFPRDFRGIDRKEEKKKQVMLRLVRKKLQKLKGSE